METQSKHMPDLTHTSTCQGTNEIKKHLHEESGMNELESYIPQIIWGNAVPKETLYIYVYIYVPSSKSNACAAAWIF